MASTKARITFRILLLTLVITVLFYVGRPLYWKISATVHDIRANKRTVSEGISQIVQEAQRFSGWFPDESDTGTFSEESSVSLKKSGAVSATGRKLLIGGLYR